MILQLIHQDYVLLRDSMTFYKHVELYDFPKPELDIECIDIFNALDHKLFFMNKRDREHPDASQEELEITHAELDLLIRVVEADMNACGDGHTEGSKLDYRLHFRVERNRVEKLLTRLLAARDHEL